MRVSDREADLEQSRIRRLPVVLLGCVLPRDPEHGLVLVLPAQSRILPALYLSYQPLFHVHLGSRFHLPNTQVSSRGGQNSVRDT